MILNKNGAYVLDTKTFKAAKDATARDLAAEKLFKSLSGFIAKPSDTLPARPGATAPDAGNGPTAPYTRSADQLRAAIAHGLPMN